jgi:hypothetical protein
MIEKINTSSKMSEDSWKTYKDHCKSPRHNMEECRTKSQEEINKNNLFSSIGCL